MNSLIRPIFAAAVAAAIDVAVAAAAATCLNAQPSSTEAPLFVFTILGYHHPPKHNYCRKNILRNK
jgi:hypothetical protein